MYAHNTYTLNISYVHTHLFYILNIVTCLSVCGCYIFSSSKNLVEWPKKSLRNILNLWLPGSWMPNYLVFQQDEHLAIIPSVGRLSSHHNGLHSPIPEPQAFIWILKIQRLIGPHVNIYIHLFLTSLNSLGHPCHLLKPQTKPPKLGQFLSHSVNGTGTTITTVIQSKLRASL